MMKSKKTEPKPIAVSLVARRLLGRGGALAEQAWLCLGRDIGTKGVLTRPSRPDCRVVGLHRCRSLLTLQETTSILAGDPYFTPCIIFFKIGEIAKITNPAPTGNTTNIK